MGTGVYTYACVSNVGRVREQNEDGVLVPGRFVRDGADAGSVPDTGGVQLFAVADGVGGAAAGEVASKRVLCELSERLCDAIDAESITRACHEVNRLLLEQAASRREFEGMSTTCTGIVIGDSGAKWFNAGDSRLYRARHDRFEQLSTDHSLREEMQDPTIPGNIITNCFGSTEFRVDVGDLTMHRHDLFLLCSDGLSDYADMRDIGTDLLSSNADGRRAEDLSYLAERFVSYALEGGGGDNVSVLLVTMGE